MKMHNWTALLLLPASLTLAQTTGVSRPSDAAVLTDDAPQPVPVAKPSAARPAAATPVAAAKNNSVVTVDGAKVTLLSPQVATAASTSDPDAMVVTEVPSRPNELPQGTILKVRMDEEVSTSGSIEGRPFTARVSEDTLKGRKVIIPAGSTMKGRITQLVAGKRINGRASIHLRPDSITLPDGSMYMIHAVAIDSDPSGNNKVDSEGSIIDKGHAKRDAIVAGGVTAGSTAVGAAFAGAPGAVVGAGVGAGIATTHWLLEEHDATLAKNSLLVFQLTEPMQLTPLRAESAPDADPLMHEKGGR
ncbi:MAG: hypothetical protein ACYCSN_03335 [Acidobacteriaceae bacterium]